MTHHPFWKKALWAALLTAAFAMTATGCGNQKDDSSTAGASTSASQTEVGTTPEGGDTAPETSIFNYQMNDDGTISITGYNGTDTDLNIPSTVDSYVVSAIADHAFEANWNLTSVTLPNGLTTIGESAFMDCGSLTSVSIPETVSTVRRAAFASCSSLTSISLPAATTTVMEEAFTGCGSLTDLTIASSTLEYDRWGLVEGAEPLAVTITCPSGSAIETWAAENGIPTQPLA